MILLLLLSMSMTFLLGHPAPSDDHSEALCSTLRMLGQSLEDARLHGSMCMDSDPRSEYHFWILFKITRYSFVLAECTTASLEVLKKCLNGVKVDRDCLEEAHMVHCNVVASSYNFTHLHWISSFRPWLRWLTRPVSVEDLSNIPKCSPQLSPFSAPVHITAALCYLQVRATFPRSRKHVKETPSQTTSSPSRPSKLTSAVGRIMDSGAGSSLRRPSSMRVGAGMGRKGSSLHRRLAPTISPGLPMAGKTITI